MPGGRSLSSQVPLSQRDYHSVRHASSKCSHSGSRRARWMCIFSELFKGPLSPATPISHSRRGSLPSVVARYAASSNYLRGRWGRSRRKGWRDVVSAWSAASSSVVVSSSPLLSTSLRPPGLSGLSDMQRIFAAHSESLCRHNRLVDWCLSPGATRSKSSCLCSRILDRCLVRGVSSCGAGPP